RGVHELHLDGARDARLGRRGEEAEDELHLRVRGRHLARVDRVEDAEDVELALARDVGRVGEEGEPDVHARSYRRRCLRGSALRPWRTSRAGPVPSSRRARLRASGWRATPRSVTIAVTSSLGVTSKAGFAILMPLGAICRSNTCVTSRGD